MNKKNNKRLNIVILSLLFIKINGAIITTAVISSNYNKNYLEFWPIVNQAWKKLINVKAKLILISEEKDLFENNEDIYQFIPVKSLSTSFQSMCIRCLYASIFEDEFCIISDADIIPLSKRYFQERIKNIPEDHIIIYRGNAYKDISRYPMCYVAARGKTFSEIFNIKSENDIRKRLVEWNNLNLGLKTDEMMLYEYINNWDHFNSRVTLLKDENETFNRIERNDSISNLDSSIEYIDYHMPRPYSIEKEKIEEITDTFGLKKVDQKELPKFSLYENLKFNLSYYINKIIKFIKPNKGTGILNKIYEFFDFISYR
jgi:hypothetical protein